MIRVYLFLFLFLLNGVGTYAINRDSVIAVTKSNKVTDSAKVFAICNLIGDSRPTEKLQVDAWFRAGIKIAKRNKDLRMEGEMLRIYGDFFRHKLNDYSAAFNYTTRAIDLFEKGHYYVELMYAYHFLARDVFERLNLVDEAIDAMKRCAYYAKKGRADELYFRLYELGWYETVNEMPEEGFEHLREAYSVTKVGDPLRMELLIWMGNTYSRRKDYQTALTYLLKASRYADSVHAEEPKYDTYRYAAYCHRELGNKDTALVYMERAIEFYIRNKNFDRIHFLAADILNWHVTDRKFKDAEKYLALLLDTTEFNYKSREDLRTYVDLAVYKYYSAIGDYKRSLIFLNDRLEAEDSIKSRNERLNLGEQNLRMNFLKQREIQRLLQKQKDLEANTKLERQRNFVWLMSGIVILAITLLFFSIRNARQRKAAYKEISVQKNEVEKQKSLVETRNKEVTDSIHYAHRIQSALMAHKDSLDEFMPDNFIYFKPKDIVSGDFYWTAKISSGRDKYFLAVCDSTGHGVPGAFMSLLNIGFLTEAIKEKNIFDPAAVFDYVRMRLIKAIGREDQRDGFDGTLICYDPSKMTITYTAANSSPLHFTSDDSGGVMVKLPFDRIPVGQAPMLRNFATHTIKVKKGDIIFMSTDGFADQFGGDKRKKFMSANLEAHFVKYAHLPMAEQMKILDKVFMEWKGSIDQIDDVCVVGFRI